VTRYKFGAASCLTVVLPGFKPRAFQPFLGSHLIISLFKLTSCSPLHSHASLPRVSIFQLIVSHPPFNLLFFFRRGSNASLPSSSFWSKLKPGGGKNAKEVDMRQQQQPQPQMALSRQRLLTLVYGDMETVRMVCTFNPLSLLSSDVTRPIVTSEASKYIRRTSPPSPSLPVPPIDSMFFLCTGTRCPSQRLGKAPAGCSVRPSGPNRLCSHPDCRKAILCFLTQLLIIYCSALCQGIMSTYAALLVPCLRLIVI
jgi:hypothetical protein